MDIKDERRLAESCPVFSTRRPRWILSASDDNPCNSFQSRDRQSCPPWDAVPMHGCLEKRDSEREREREIDVGDDRRLTLNGQGTCAPFRVVKSKEIRDTGSQYDEDNQDTDRVEDPYPTTIMDDPLDAFWTRVTVDTLRTIDHDDGKCTNVVLFPIPVGWR